MATFLVRWQGDPSSKRAEIRQATRFRNVHRILLRMGLRLTHTDPEGYLVYSDEAPNESQLR